MKGITLVAWALVGLRTSNAGVCEELEIPMDTVEVPGVGWVCKVRECATVTLNHRGKPTCVSCSQDAADPFDSTPRSEFCPVELGICVNGICQPRNSAYFENNFGKKWTGLGTFSAVTATHYGGSMACGAYPGHYDVEAVVPCFQRIGIDGPAAVPPMMYGAGASDGQACFKNNNLCYKLVGVEGVVRTVALTDRCGGYVQCSGGKIPIEDIRSTFYFPPIAEAPGVTSWADANQCVQNEGARIHSGIGQRCWFYTDGGVGEDKAICCPGSCSAWGPNGLREQVDWCGSNSHPHFDLPVHILDALCDNSRGGGINAGSCALKWVEPIKCPVHPKAGRCCTGSCADCNLKSAGNCGLDAASCRDCGGMYCGGDDYLDICNVPADKIPPPIAGWTERPTDPPRIGGANSMTAVPPPEFKETPSHWPGLGATMAPSGSTPATSGQWGGQETTQGHQQTQGQQQTQGEQPQSSTHAYTHPTQGQTHGPQYQQTGTALVVPGEEVGGGVTPGIAIGAAAAGAAVLGAAAFAAMKLAPSPTPVEAMFEGEEAGMEDATEREELAMARSVDFS